MPRKVILDVDPGVDSAVGICLALGEPALEVVALTAVAGGVRREQPRGKVRAFV